MSDSPSAQRLSPSAELFESRHIGPDASETAEMLRVIGAPTLDALMDEAIPARIRLTKPLNLPNGQSEQQFLRALHDIASRNQVFRSYIGLGYYGCVTPSVILRNVLVESRLVHAVRPIRPRSTQGRRGGGGGGGVEGVARCRRWSAT